MEIELLKKVIHIKRLIDRISCGRVEEAEMARKLLEEIIAESA